MKYFSKKLSLLLCLLLFLSSFMANYNIAKASSLEQKYSIVQKKITTQLENNVDPTSIMENLSSDDIQILLDFYSQNDSSIVSTYGFKPNIVNHPEVKKIDSIANEYFAYFTNTGEIPTVYETYAALTYSEIMGQLDYTYTYNQIAIHLVSIASYMGLSSAFPFLSLVALVAGIGLIGFSSLVIAYSAIAVGTNNLISTWYIKHYRELEDSRQITAAVITQKENGARYWRCTLSNIGGLGGIKVHEVIQEYKAISLIIDNNYFQNVLAVDVTTAGHVATLASPLYGFTMDSAHDAGKYPLNRPHFHIIRDRMQTHGLTHIFYIM